jgi:uncharacterized membrane protein YecN with MAPEG domain
MDGTGMATVALYAGLNALILLWIAGSTSRVRRQTGIYIGDGGNLHLIRIMRGHANAIEIVPMALILMLLMAGMGAPAWVIHIFGIALTVGRVLHAAYFIPAEAPLWLRVAGAGLSLAALALAAVGVVGHAIATLV